MSPLLRWSGNVLLAAIVAASVYGGYLVWQNKLLHGQASAFTTTFVQEAAGRWDSQVLVRQAADGWLRPDEEAAMPALFERLSRLGKLKTLRQPVGRVGHGAFPFTRINGAWADYTVAAEFENGSSEIRLILQRVDDGWRIWGFQWRPGTPAGK